ncbi:phage terminase large subunit family protein [Mycobacterium sp. MBM]|nr:phage terminase large subunit family protein [Mycobacterium sp. MBM]
MEIRTEFALDTDHFLRRECPNCGQEFKWRDGEAEGHPGDAVEPARYTCPLCGRQADHDAWLTQDQLGYQQEMVDFYAPDAINAELKKAFGKNFKPGRNTAPAPRVLFEPDDMIIIEPPCHPWEPVKVPEERADSGPLFCLVCGEIYRA